MAIIDELLVALGYEYEDEELEEFQSGINSTTDILKKLLTAVAATAAAITALVVTTSKASDEQGKFAAEIGESVGMVDALQFALIRSGGSADGMTSSLKALATRAAEAARGIGSGLEAFGILGIEVSKSNGEIKKSSELLLEVSKRFQTLDKFQQIELAEKLGLGASIRLLQQGPGAIRDLINEAEALGVTTGQDAAISAEFTDSLTNLWQTVKAISRTITRELAPVLKRTTDQFIEWWKANKQLIESNIKDWIDSITVAFKLLTIAVGVFVASRLVTHLIQLIALMRGVSIAALVMNAAVMLLPILITSAVTALLLLIEDAKTFFEGGESFIGDMIKKFPQWTKELNVIAKVFATVWDLTSMIWDGWKAIFDLFKKEEIKNVLPTNENVKKEDSIWNALFTGWPEFFNDMFGGGGTIAPGLSVPSSVQNSSKIQNIDKVEINVNGVSDPTATAREVSNLFEQTAQDLDSAVDQ